MERCSRPRVHKEERTDFSDSKLGHGMDKPKRKRAIAEALRKAAGKDDFREYMATGHLAIPTDERFEELLKSLHEAEEPEE